MISELDKSRCYTVKISYVARELKHNRIAGFQTIYHALEVGERRYGHPVNARDYIALIEGLLSPYPHFSCESVGIKFLEEKATNAS